MHNKFLNRLALLVLFALPTYCLGGDTLCNSKEHVYFSCTVKGSGKLISLCGNSLEDEDRFWLQYRFGAIGKIELAYPQRKKLFRESGFKIRRSRRAFGYDGEVNFTNGGWSYTVFFLPLPGDSEQSGIRVARDRDDLSTAPIECYGGLKLPHYSAFSRLVSKYENDRQLQWER